MVEFAPVAPISLLRKLGDDAGHYHLLLVHEVMERPTDHHIYWETRPDDFVILDNSVIELGHPAPIGVMLAWAGILPENHVIVLPDVIGDKAGTITMCQDALSSSKASSRERFLGVVQGRTWEEAVECANWYKDQDIQYVSVPRHFGDRLGTRIGLTSEISGLGLKMHLLGFSENIEDDLAAAKLPGVIGIDSAVPIWSQSLFVTNTSRPSDYLEWTELPKWAIGNIRSVRKWLNGAKDVPTQEELAGQGERSQVRS